MERKETIGGLPFRKDSIQLTRIEKTLYEELKGWKGFLGRVGQVYQNGFDLIKEEGRKVIHFRSERWLHSPFGAILDRPIKQLKGEVSLMEGDLFWKAGQSVLRRSRDGLSIELEPLDIVDLRRTLSSSPPGSETMLSSIRTLTDEIVKSGKFEGMAGTSLLLRNECPATFPDFPFSVSLWSRHALPQAKRLVEAAVKEDLVLFQEVWEGLLGLGPGLTPAADDFLVGFLAAHKLFSSPFGLRLADDGVKTRLEERARIKTVPISSEFLKCALGGIFSEILYLAFEDLRFRAENGGTKQIEYFLKWGHSSGADTLTGVVFGLLSMILPSGDLNPMKIMPR